MALSQHRARRKFSGGRFKAARKKRVYELGNHPTDTHLGETERKVVRGKGGNTKQRLLRADVINVMVNGKAQQATIVTVKENAANINFVRRNIMTKGAIVETNIGRVKISSRPGQHGVLNGIKVA